MAGANDTSELERRLAEVDALRRRVLNVIPHALRTPITTLRGLAEALPAASDEEVREQIGPALRRLAAQAEHLLDDMLIAAGYTTALPTTSPVATAVGPTVRRVWDELGGGLDLSVVGDEGTEVTAPDGSLFKMLVHLLDNAAKYWGDQPVRVDVSDEAGADGRVRIDIRTAGDAPKDLEMLTEPFYRGEAAVIRASGLGVGLTVAEALAVQAGGTLEVLGDDDGGMITRLELPA